MPDATLNLLRGVATALAMLAFLSVVAWAWSRRRRDSFDAAARLPLEEDPDILEAPARSKRRRS
jgi:cytochrome c oxidase cbb3-type subunit IV